MSLPAETVYRVRKVDIFRGTDKGWMVDGPGLMYARGVIPNKGGTMSEANAHALASLLEAAYAAGRADQQRAVQQALGIGDLQGEVRRLSDRIDDRG